MSEEKCIKRKDNIIILDDNKRRKNNNDDIDDSCHVLWNQAPFWERVFELLPVPENKIFLTCKAGMEMTKKYAKHFKTKKLINLKYNFLEDYYNKYFPNIRFVESSENFPSNLPEMNCWENLEELIFTNFYDGSYFSLEQFKNLRKLNLSNTQDNYDIFPEDIEYRELELPHYKIRDLDKCSELRELNLKGYLSIDNLLLEEISKLTKLEKLDIGQWLNINEMPPSTHEFFFDNHIDVLPVFINLKTLSISGCHQITNYDFLRVMPYLIELDISGIMNDGNYIELIEILKNLKDLRSLRLCSVNVLSISVFNDLINKLSEIKQIKHLCIGGLIYHFQWINLTNIVDPELVYRKHLLPDYGLFDHLDSICLAGMNLYQGLDIMDPIIEKVIKRLPNIKYIHMSYPFILKNISLGNTVLKKDCLESHFLVAK